MNFIDLNDDCLLLILQKLNNKQLEEISILDQEFKILCQDDTIWKEKLLNDYNINKKDLFGNQTKHKTNKQKILHKNIEYTKFYDIYKYIIPDSYLFIDIMGGPYTGKLYIIEKRKVTIGRSRNNDISLLLDENLSRFHLFITYMENSYWITDINSTNGTFKNIQNINHSNNIPLAYNIGYKIKHNYSYTLGKSDILCKYVL